ncbi:MAG: aminotransferase class IV family protein [Rhizobiaceae bacterium]|nr:aminotransferase class IV family protein [Rhizobiaceae bacterium]
MPAQGTVRDGIPAGIGLIETLGWEPGAGFLRLDRHLARLVASAAALALPCDPAAVERALGSVSGNGRMRVRLHLDQHGAATVTAQPFAPLASGTVWRLRIAGTRLSSNDPLLRHKTTHRAAYEAARAEFSIGEADEVLLLNERGEICEGTITSLFVDMGDGGPLLTPPLSSGLLAGVLRQALLEDGRAIEFILTLADLNDARALYVGNSLRGLIPARLASH